jgi:hypothetical protein
MGGDFAGLERQHCGVATILSWQGLVDCDRGKFLR